MLLDLPRVEYNSKNKVKKSDLEFVKEQNRLLAEKRAAGEKTGLNFEEILKRSSAAKK